MEAVLAAGPVNGSRLRKMVSEREAVEQESKVITWKVDGRSWGLQPAGGGNWNHTKTKNGQAKKVGID